MKGYTLGAECNYDDPILTYKAVGGSVWTDFQSCFATYQHNEGKIRLIDGSLVPMGIYELEIELEDLGEDNGGNHYYLTNAARITGKVSL